MIYKYLLKICKSCYTKFIENARNNYNGEKLTQKSNNWKERLRKADDSISGKLGSNSS